MRKIKVEDKYKTAFIKKTDFIARTGKQTCIRPEYHERIANIAHSIGKREISISDFLDNVLTDHFNRNNDVLMNLFNEYKGQLR